MEETSLAARLDCDERGAGLCRFGCKYSGCIDALLLESLDNRRPQHIVPHQSRGSTCMPSFAIATPALQTFPPVVSVIELSRPSPPAPAAGEIHRLANHIRHD